MESPISSPAAESCLAGKRHAHSWGNFVRVSATFVMRHLLPIDRRRRLRVVHVTQGLDMGGLEKLLVEFARHADRDRFELHFVSLGGRGVLAREVEACGWSVPALPGADG